YVAQERDADPLPLEEGEVGIDFAHASPGEVERHARTGYVGDDQVVDPGQTNESRGRFDDGATCPVRGLSEHGATGGLAAALQLVGRRMDRLEATSRIRIQHRQGHDPERDAIPGCAELLRRAEAPGLPRAAARAERLRHTRSGLPRWRRSPP